tara:strand:- start:723 stop:1559 length:837 start_codon:yes stop_codon:yes gene_type:complete
MTTTVMHNQSAAEYHADPGASASRLKQFQRSAAHMRYAMDNPQEPTPAMIIGSATHSAILEPDLFVKEWGRLPEGDGRSKAVKEAKAELIVQFGVGQILKPDVYDNILAMRDSVLDNALALDLLDGADTEVSHYWAERYIRGIKPLEVDCKARIDALPREDSMWNHCVVDIKTTANASPEEFRRSCFNFGYHIQAPHYLSAANRGRFIFIVVERDAPHCVAIYELDDDALELGRQTRDSLLGQWAFCEAEEAEGLPDAWPGFPVEIQELSLPGWAYTQ